MKLYCVKVNYKDQGLDVVHVLANNDKEVYIRFDAHKAECDKYNYPVDGYSFFHLYEVDGLDLDKALNRYERIDGEIKQIY